MNDDKIIISVERGGLKAKFEVWDGSYIGDYEYTFKALLKWLSFQDESINRLIASGDDDGREE